MTRPRVLTDQELSAFMSAVRARKHRNAVRDNALFSLLANTGMRPSEVLRLTLADVRASGGAPFVRVRRSPLGRVVRPITDLALHPRVARAVALHVRAVRSGADRRVFRITKRQAERLFHYYARIAGIETQHKLYDLRHTVGARLWLHTKDLRLIHGVMGHARMNTAEKYARISPRELLEAMEQVGSIL